MLKHSFNYGETVQLLLEEITWDYMDHAARKEKALEMAKEDLAGKPDNIKEKIVAQFEFILNAESLRFQLNCSNL